MTLKHSKNKLELNKTEKAFSHMLLEMFLEMNNNYYVDSDNQYQHFPLVAILTRISPYFDFDGKYYRTRANKGRSRLRASLE